MENTSLILGYPMVACAQRFLHLHDNDADLDMPICVYFERKGDVVNLSPAPTWWHYFGSGLAILDLFDWGSTYTILALITYDQAAP